MRLSQPAGATWLIAVILGVLGFVMQFGLLRLPGMAIDPFWLVAIAFVLLAIAPLVKGL